MTNFNFTGKEKKIVRLSSDHFLFLSLALFYILIVLCSWIVGLHKHQHKLRNAYIRNCPAVMCITTQFHAVIIHLLCDTNRPNSVSNLHYVQALPGLETTAARNGCQSEQCQLERISISWTAAGQHILKRNEKKSGNVFEGERKTRTATSSVIGWCQHFIWWDRLKCADSSNFKTRGFETGAEGDEFEAAWCHFTYSFRYCQW